MAGRVLQAKIDRVYHGFPERSGLERSVPNFWGSFETDLWEAAPPLEETLSDLAQVVADPALAPLLSQSAAVAGAAVGVAHLILSEAQLLEVGRAALRRQPFLPVALERPQGGGTMVMRCYPVYAEWLVNSIQPGAFSWGAGAARTMVTNLSGFEACAEAFRSVGKDPEIIFTAPRVHFFQGAVA
jgi:hypothetical protein